jgi:hypothetical protein
MIDLGLPSERQFVKRDNFFVYTSSRPYDSPKFLQPLLYSSPFCSIRPTLDKDVKKTHTCCSELWLPPCNVVRSKEHVAYYLLYGTINAMTSDHWHSLDCKSIRIWYPAIAISYKFD